MQVWLFAEIDEALEMLRLTLNAWARHEEEMERLRSVVRKPARRAEDLNCWNRREDAG